MNSRRTGIDPRSTDWAGRISLPAVVSRGQRLCCPSPETTPMFRASHSLPWLVPSLTYEFSEMKGQARNSEGDTTGIYKSIDEES